MILSVKDNVKGIFLMTPYYMEPNGEDWMRKRMDTYGAICSELAEKYGCRFIDLQAVFNDYFQYRHSSLPDPDNLCSMSRFHAADAARLHTVTYRLARWRRFVQ